MKKLLIAAFVSLALMSACGGAGSNTGSDVAIDPNAPPKINLKLNGKDSSWDVKSAAVYPSEMFFTSPSKPAIKVSAHTIYIANYEMETTGASWMNNPLTAPEQVRINMQLTGEEGTDMKSPFKVGTYSATAPNVNGVRVVSVRTFADGKQTQTDFGSAWNRNTTGEVKITSATADTVTGQVNLTAGDKSIKGTFTARMPKA